MTAFSYSPSALPPRFGKSLMSASVLALLAACGGGGGETPAQTPVASASTSVSATVIDGPLENATLCLDKNINSDCDSGEPSGKTDVSGKATMTVDNADVGKYPVIAVVGTDARDADTGKVTVPYILKAPADQAAVVSPLTTLVQTQVETTGSTSKDAAAAVQQQLGMTTSPMDDFTKDGSAAGKQAGTVARLIVVTTQKQLQSTDGALGTDGKPLSAQQRNAVITTQLLTQLQTLATAVLDNPTLADPGKSVAEKEDSMKVAASQVATASGLSKDNIGIVAAAQARPKTPDTGAGAAVATSSLRWFTFSDPGNFFLRGFESTAAQNTPDANGKRYYTEFRAQIENGQEIPWVRKQIYWTGSEWFACPSDFVNEQTAVATTGESESLYCKALRSRTSRSERDISGLKIRDIVREVRAYPYQDGAHGSFANWGPKPEQVPADATWPAGSSLSYRTAADLGGGQYYNSADGQALIPPANNPSTTNISLWVTATLQTFIAWNAGDFASNVTAGQVGGNNSHVLVGRRDYKKPDGSAGYKRYMVGFETGGEQRARFYECEGDMSTLPQNRTLFINGISTCKVILVSNYQIATQGDAKVLSFSSEPLQLNTSNSQNYRLFIERGGVTYKGYKDKKAMSYQQRLNQPATEALLKSLGVDVDKLNR